MADLFNQQISATYSGLLKTSSSGVLSASLSQISDGRGNTSPLYLSTDSIQFYGAYSFPNADGSANQVLKTDGAGVLTWADDANTGTVTSVALSVPTGLTVTGSPITTNGTITIGGTLGVANGGTGATTLTGILVGNGTSAISVVSDGIVSGQVLSTNANGTYSFIDAAGGDVTKTGTITANQIAVWNDSTDELRSDETVTIGTDHSITLYQPNTNSNTTNYIIGGGSSMTTGELNTGFGSSVLTLNTTGVGNIAIGSDSLTTNVSGYNNVAVGVNTLKRTTASNNVAIGNSVLQFDTTGYKNTAIGGLSQSNITTAYENTSLGYNSLIFNSTGIQNTAIGWNSLKGLSTYSASNNTALGSNSGSAITTGSNNVIIGSNTGSTIATSSSNIIISDGSGTIRQSFDFTGAATFNGAVNVVDAYANDPLIKLATNTSGNAEVQIRTATTSYNAGIGVVTSGYDFNIFTENTPKLTIASGGNVGIGTGSTIYADLEIKRASEVTVALHNSSSITSGNRGNISFYNSSVSTVALIKAVADTDTVGTALEFYTRPVGGSLTNSLTISSGGNVGIGTSGTPAYLLTASGTNLPYIASVTANVQTVIASDETNGRAYIGTRTDHPIAFVVNGNEKMRIKSVGAVGIDNLSPDSFSGSGSVSSSLVIGKGTPSISPQLTLWQGNSAQATINFASSNSGIGQYEGRIRYTRDTGVMDFRVNSNDALSISSTGTTTASRGDAGTLIQATSSSGAGSGIINFFSSLPSSADNTNCSHFQGTTQGINSWRLYGNGSSSWTSDSRLKRDIETTRDGYIDDVKQLRVVKYKWKNDPNSSLELGLIAQEVETIFPSLVVEDKNSVGDEVLYNEDDKIPNGKKVGDVKIEGTTYKSVKYSVLPMILLKAIQEQQTIIEDLKARIETLEG